MEEEKGKIVVSWSESDTVFQSWRKKRREDDDDETLLQSCISKKRRHVPDASRKYTGKDIGNRRDDENESSIFISNDVLEEIFLRLPVKAVIRFQTVSKHWRRRIESRSFMERHMLHQKSTHEPPRLLCLTPYGERNLTLTTMRWSESCSGTCLVEEVPAHHIERQQPELYFGITQCCDGIVCIFDEDTLTTPVTVMNPAMKRSKILPLSMFQRQYLEKTKPLPDVLIYPGFGKDHVTGTYKLVWLHNDLSDYTLSCEVFDFEANKWSYVMNTPCDIIASHQPIFAEGWLYWLAGGKQFGDRKVLAYNLHTEMFRVITNRIVSEAPIMEAVRIFSLNDRIWLTDFRGDGNGIQHFWRIKNALESHWESQKMFSIDSRLISPWFVSDDESDDESSTSWPNITLVATSEDNKKVTVSKSFSSQLVQLLPRPTSLCFCSAFSGPPDTEFVPYFPSLVFPL